MHTPFRSVEIGERAPYAREYAESTKDHTHIFLSFSYLISTDIYLTRHDALRFFFGLRIGLFTAPHCAKHHSSGKQGV